MKKVFAALLLIITLSVSAVALSGCTDGISSESDLYGSFFTADDLKCITLGENNSAVVSIYRKDGVMSENYYARYDLIGDKIELRDGDYWGNVKYVVTIVDADTLSIESPYEEDMTDGKPKMIEFVRDTEYDHTDSE